MFKRSGVLKEFGPEGLKVVEKVAASPSLGKFAPFRGGGEKTFSLRIDADEYTKDSFSRYFPLFEKYKEAITIFFNAYSFRNAKDEILKCRDIGCEIQSHAYYHYTYSDYESNRYNINKAKMFFQGMGIETNGFVSPSGRWSPELMKALEDEGYVYASEFSYDYMGYPHYPYIDNRASSILEIPVFPVAPELFFQKDGFEVSSVLNYYYVTISELMKHDIPPIIYAHTEPKMPFVPDFLGSICNYAINEKGLKPVQMGKIHNSYKRMIREDNDPQMKMKVKQEPAMEFLGRPIQLSLYNIIKEIVKDILDYETITPIQELKCKKVRKMLKLLARRIFKSS